MTELEELKLAYAECSRQRNELLNKLKFQAQRTWVELTDEELDDIYQGAGKNDLRRAREVIAAFKERNT